MLADISVTSYHRKRPKLPPPELDPPPWTPCSSELNILVKSSSKLFIIASTAIKFLLDDKRCNPKAQMMDLMQAMTIDKAGATPLNTLDSVYTQILSVAIPLNSSPEMLSRFHSVISTIVLLRDPLPIRPLAILLQRDVNDVKGPWLISNLSFFSLSLKRHLAFTINHYMISLRTQNSVHITPDSMYRLEYNMLVLQRTAFE